MVEQPSTGTAPGPDTAAAAAAVRRRWPAVASAVWGMLALLTLGLSAGSVPSRYDQLLGFAAENERALRGLGMSNDFYATYITALGIAIVLVHVLIAAVLSSRRSDDWMALFVSFALLVNGSITPLSPAHALITAHPSFAPAVSLMIYLALVSSVILLYVFPTGRFVPAWTPLPAVIWAALTLPAVFFPDAIVSFLRLPLVIQVVVLLGWAGTGAYAQTYRYVYVSTPVQRQQTKWAVLGLVAAVVGPLAYFLSFFIIPSLGDSDVPNLLYQRVGSGFFTFSVLFRIAGLTVLTFGLLLFPVSFAIAVLRYRLWDVGVVINRTLVYGALTGSLVLVYLFSVVLLQLAFRSITGQGTALAIVVSTLAIAALFQPLRQRLQLGIDRRFFRQKYDAAQTLAAFSSTLRNEVDMDRLSQALVDVVEETMQPEHVSLWLLDSDVEAQNVRRETQSAERET